MARQPYYDDSDQLPYRARPAQPPNGAQPQGPQPAVNPQASAPQPAAAPQTQPFDRTGFRDAWMGSSGSMDSFLQQHPEYSGVTPAGGSKGDLYKLPSGEYMDLQIAKGVNGDNAQHGWTGAGSWDGRGGPPGGGQVGSMGANGMLTGSADAGITGGGGYLGTFRQAMLDALKQYQQPTDLNSPTLAPQLNASRIANQRGIERARQTAAEQAYASGDLHSSGYDQTQRQILEHAGADQAQTEGGLVDNAEARRTSMLNSLLGMGSGQGLQELLSNNQLGYNYAQLGQQKQLAGDELGYHYANLQNSMNRDALLASLGYYGG